MIKPTRKKLLLTAYVIENDGNLHVSPFAAQVGQVFFESSRSAIFEAALIGDELVLERILAAVIEIIIVFVTSAEVSRP